jgi:DnaK suppressor protein
MTMEKADLEQFRMNLLQLRTELRDLEESGKDAAKPVELDQASVGRLSRMDAMQAQQMAQATDRRRQQQVARIEAALRRIESGDYGYCYVCGEEIDIRRLAVDPTITRCIKCVEE